MKTKSINKYSQLSTKQALVFFFILESKLGSLQFIKRKNCACVTIKQVIILPAGSISLERPSTAIKDREMLSSSSSRGEPFSRNDCSEISK